MLLMISSEADKNAFSTFNKTHFKSFQVFLHKTGKRKFMAPLLGRRETLSPIGASRTCTCTSTCKCHSSRLSIKHAYVYFILWCTKSDELATFAMYMLFRLQVIPYFLKFHHGFHEFLLFCHLVASSCFFRGGFVVDARSGGKGESCDACWICQGPAGDGSGGHRGGRGRFSPILTVANILFKEVGKKKHQLHHRCKIYPPWVVFLWNTYVKPPLSRRVLCAHFLKWQSKKAQKVDFWFRQEALFSNLIRKHEVPLPGLMKHCSSVFLLGFGTLQHKLLSLFDSVQGRFPIREDMYEQIGGWLGVLVSTCFFKLFATLPPPIRWGTRGNYFRIWNLFLLFQIELGKKTPS